MDSEAPTLLNLPAELLLEILEHVDDEELYQLGLTCKHLHFPAFSTFLKKNQISDPSNSGWFYAYKSPPQTLPIINAALWIKNIPHITYNLNQGYDRLRDDVANLHKLVKRMDRIHNFRIHLSLAENGVWTAKEKKLDRENWARRFTAVLDQAIKKGCKQLEVGGGGSLSKLYTEDEPPGIPIIDSSTQKEDTLSNGPVSTTVETEAVGESIDTATPLHIVQPEYAEKQKTKKKFGRSLRKMVSGIFGRRRVVSSSASAPPEMKPTELVLAKTSAIKLAAPAAPPVSVLNGVTLQSSMLFGYTFYPWTVQMFAKGSSSITQLNLNCSDVPSETWSHLFSSITLPLLSRLDIATQMFQNSQTIVQTPKFLDVLGFLERHPSIEYLVMQGIERPEDAPVLDKPILPNLGFVVAHPIWISSLLGLLDTHPDSLPRLNAIGITTEYYSFLDPAEYQHIYELVDNALRKVARLPRTITLTLQVPTQHGLTEWFDQHAAIGKENSIISSLSCVANLVLSTRYFAGFGRDTAPHLMPWLMLFPSFHCLKLMDMPEEVKGYRLVKDNNFLRRLAVECPTLKSVETLESVIMLSTLWDGADPEMSS